MSSEPRTRKPPRDLDRGKDPSFGWYRGHPQSFEFCPRPEFFELADATAQAKRTRLGYDRFYVLWQAVRNVAQVPGAAAEIGSYRGGSAFFIASAFLRMVGHEVPFHIFDTFEGHPAQSLTEHDSFQTEGLFSETSYHAVREYLSPFRQLQIHQGDVAASLAGLAETTYRFVHIDTDLYLPTLQCLTYFGARLSERAVMVVDDYTSRKCPGVARAVSEYLSGTDGFHVWDTRTEQLVLLKRG